jgi:hypothetical protein
MLRHRAWPLAILITLHAAVLAPLSAAPVPQPIPPALKAAASAAEVAGRALFRSHGADPAQHPPLIAKAIATATAALKSRCTAPPRFAVLDDQQPTAEGIVLYQIPQLPPEKQGLMVGGFARIVISADGGKMLSAQPALECLPSATDPGRAPGPVVLVEPQSTVPTEYHVFANLLSRQRLIVLTSAGSWQIDRGVIQYIDLPK